MTSRIWFVKNMTHEGAGLFSAFAEREKIPFGIVDLHEGAEFPEVSRGSAVVVLGGPNSANDRTARVLDELDALRGCMKQNIPVLGICLGLQLLVKAAGGDVYRNPVKEVGFRDPSGQMFEIEKTEAGSNDPLLEGLPDRVKVFQLHGETVHLTGAMTCLALGRTCANQVVKVSDRAYGIQGHVELSKQMFEDWLEADEDLRAMDCVKLRNDFSVCRQELERSSETIFKNFLKIAGILR